MQVLFLVLNKVEVLEPLLQQLGAGGVKGATVLDSTGMARILNTHDDAPMFSMIRHLFNPERRMNKTLFMVLEDEQVEPARQIIREVTGGLDQPDTGILFTIPALFVEGLDART